jgi:hypothetical protein
VFSGVGFFTRLATEHGPSRYGFKAPGTLWLLSQFGLTCASLHPVIEHRSYIVAEIPEPMLGARLRQTNNNQASGSF